jgi:hypothetical protein
MRPASKEAGFVFSGSLSASITSMSHLGSHARYELELVGEEPEIIDWYVKVVETFAEFGHTGESAEYTTRVLEQLLRYKNLTPLTDDPAEWLDVTEYTEQKSKLWQSVRNSAAFSTTEGKTYILSHEEDYIEHKTLPAPTEMFQVPKGKIPLDRLPKKKK